MNHAHAVAVEPKLIAAVAPAAFGIDPRTKRNRLDDDITAWLEIQEDAELDLIASDVSHRQQREFRRSLHD